MRRRYFVLLVLVLLYGGIRTALLGGWDSWAGGLAFFGLIVKGSQGVGGIFIMGC